MKLNPITLLRDLLQQLPDSVRTVLYVAFLVAGLTSGVCHYFGVTGIGPVDVSDLDHLLVVLTPLFGATAAANLKKRPVKASLSAADVRRVVREELTSATTTVRHGTKSTPSRPI